MTQPTNRHIPVMLPEVLENLAPTDCDLMLDGTFGGGGYTLAILKSADCRVIAIDRDPDAISLGQPLRREHAGRLRLVEGRYSAMAEIVRQCGEEFADGVVLDIGVSSNQIDVGERGFSFQMDGPLDMRMGKTGETAADLVAHLDQAALADLIFHLGGERQSRKIAAAIVHARADQPITTTMQLAQLIENAVPRHFREGKRSIHPATKTFQALRIAVNAELEELRAGLVAAEKILRPGGRLVVVSFHSLEDRIVKDFLVERSGRAASVSRHLPSVESAIPAASFKVKKLSAVKPSDGEMARNPRARSARLRTAVRTAAPAWPERQAA